MAPPHHPFGLLYYIRSMACMTGIMPKTGRKRVLLGKCVCSEMCTPYNDNNVATVRKMAELLVMYATSSCQYARMLGKSDGMRAHTNSCIPYIIRSLMKGQSCRLWNKGGKSGIQSIVLLDDELRLRSTSIDCDRNARSPLAFVFFSISDGSILSANASA